MESAQNKLTTNFQRNTDVPESPCKQTAAWSLKVFQEIKVCCFITKSKYQTKAERRRWRRLQKLSWHNQVLIPVKRSGFGTFIIWPTDLCDVPSDLKLWLFMLSDVVCLLVFFYFVGLQLMFVVFTDVFPDSSHAQKLVRTIYYKLRELEATSWNNLDSDMYSVLLTYIVEDDYLTI